MIGWASIKWWCLSFFESLDHSVGQHIGVINQNMINCRINHLLQFTKVGVKGNLPRQRQILIIDDLPTPVQAKKL